MEENLTAKQIANLEHERRNPTYMELFPLTEDELALLKEDEALYFQNPELWGAEAKPEHVM